MGIDRLLFCQSLLTLVPRDNGFASFRLNDGVDLRPRVGLANVEAREIMKDRNQTIAGGVFGVVPPYTIEVDSGHTDQTQLHTSVAAPAQRLA